GRRCPDAGWSGRTMADEIAGAHGVYLVDVEADRVVGYGGVRALPGGSDADIQTIALDADFRGRGRGRALLQALIAQALARGARELFLEVRADNPVARSLYDSEGFEELGCRPRYYQPADVDAVVMRLDLRAWAASRGTQGTEGEVRRADAGAPPADRAELGQSSAPDGSGAAEETIA